jgi:hypothetical protein
MLLHRFNSLQFPQRWRSDSTYAVFRGTAIALIQTAPEISVLRSIAAPSILYPATSWCVADCAYSGTTVEACRNRH